MVQCCFFLLSSSNISFTVLLVWYSAVAFIKRRTVSDSVSAFPAPDDIMNNMMACIIRGLVLIAFLISFFVGRSL